MPLSITATLDALSAMRRPGWYNAFSPQSWGMRISTNIAICSDDRTLGLVCGIDNVGGGNGVHQQGSGHVLAASSTLNRLEFSKPDELWQNRYRKRS